MTLNIVIASESLAPPLNESTLQVSFSPTRTMSLEFTYRYSECYYYINLSYVILRKRLILIIV